MEKNAWNFGTMIGLIISTLIIPLIGIIAGIKNVKFQARKKQSFTLLLIGGLMLALWVLHFTMPHH